MYVLDPNGEGDPRAFTVTIELDHALKQQHHAYVEFNVNASG